MADAAIHDLLPEPDGTPPVKHLNRVQLVIHIALPNPAFEAVCKTEQRAPRGAPIAQAVQHRKAARKVTGLVAQRRLTALWRHPLQTDRRTSPKPLLKREPLQAHVRQAPAIYQNPLGTARQRKLKIAGQ